MLYVYNFNHFVLKVHFLIENPITAAKVNPQIIVIPKAKLSSFYEITFIC